jgi:hypothetical protein
MSRPVGVTASAVVAILGSVLLLLFAVMGVASQFMIPPQSQLPNSTQLLIGGAAIFAALAGLGIWTSVGLFRLRSWARISIVVFACFLAASCVFGLAVTMAMPLPPGFSRGTEHTFRQSMAAIYGTPLAIAVWWLIQFNTRSTKSAFASPMPGGAPERPLSISIIAWASIAGGVSILLLILMNTPAFLFGAIFTGWSAGVIYAIFAAISLYIGKGLLDLQERARLLAIGWYVFSFVHMGLITMVPALRQRVVVLQQALARNQKTPVVFDQSAFTNVLLAFSAIVVAATIWFLMRNRAAFGRPEPAY